MFARRTTTAGLIVASLAASLAAATPAHAQYRVRYGYSNLAPLTAPSITPYVGYMDMGRYVHGPLGTTPSGADAGLVGVQLTLPFSPMFALVGNVAHANSTLVFFDPPGGGPTIGNSEVWIYDADMQLGMPFRSASGHWVDPFLQFGVGGMRYETQNTAGSANSTNFTVNVGVGLDYAISRQIGIRMLAKDYIGHWSEPGPYVYGYNDRFTNNYSISAGLKLGL
jgi:opacity protein-like surface antigen